MVVVVGAWRAPCAARGRHNGVELGGRRALGGWLGQWHGANGGATGLLGDRTELHVVRGGDNSNAVADVDEGLWSVVASPEVIITPAGRTLERGLRVSHGSGEALE